MSFTQEEYERKYKTITIRSIKPSFPTSLLNEVTDTKETQRIRLSSANFLKAIALQSVGPFAKLTTIQLHPEAETVLVSNVSSQVMSVFEYGNNPLLKLVVAQLTASRRSTPDGGWLYVYLVASLVCMSNYHDIDHVPLSLVTSVVSVLYQWCSDGLKKQTRIPCSFWKSFPDTPSAVTLYNALATSILTSKQSLLCWNYKKCSFIARLIVQAHVSGLNSNMSSNVRICFAPINFEDSYVLEDAILLDKPIPDAWDKRLINFKCSATAIYNVSLNLDDFSEKEFSSSNSAFQIYSNLVNLWIKRGVKIVLCQKLMAPILKFLAYQAGIFAIERLSLLHISAVHAIVGGTMQSVLNMDENAQCGFVNLDTIIIGVKQFLRLSSCEPDSSSCSTLILGCDVSEPVESVVSSIFKMLSNENDFIISGGGSCELQIANHLRFCAAFPKLPGWTISQIGFASEMAIYLAEALECFACQLSGWEDWREAADYIQQKSKKENKYFGWCAESMEVPLDKLQIVDSYNVKSRVLEVAFDMANSLLKIGDIVRDVR